MSPATIGTATKPCPGRTRSQKCLLTKGHFGVHQYPPPPLLEKSIREACADILILDGWRRLPMEQNFSEKKRKTVGEPGMADDLFIRYGPGVLPETGHISSDAWRMIGGCAQVMWVEWKRLLPVKRGKTWGRATKASNEQKAWHALERSRGALTLIAGEDFPASVDGFRDFYKASGLARRCA